MTFNQEAAVKKSKQKAAVARQHDGKSLGAGCGDALNRGVLDLRPSLLLLLV